MKSCPSYDDETFRLHTLFPRAQLIISTLLLVGQSYGLVSAVRYTTGARRQASRSNHHPLRPAYFFSPQHTATAKIPDQLPPTRVRGAQPVSETLPEADWKQEANKSKHRQPWEDQDQHGKAAGQREQPWQSPVWGLQATLQIISSPSELGAL